MGKLDKVMSIISLITVISVTGYLVIGDINCRANGGVYVKQSLGTPVCVKHI